MSREDYKKQVTAVVEEVINAISQPYGSVPYEKSDGTKGPLVKKVKTIEKRSISVPLADDTAAADVLRTQDLDVVQR